MAPPDKPMMLAIEQHLLNIAVPILYDDPIHLDQLGTGTFFEHEGLHFLVTARHIIEGKQRDLVVVPSSPKGPRVISLGTSEFVDAVDEPGADIDLMVIVLRDPAVVADLKAAWSFLAVSRTATPPDEGDFVLCGYPSERIKVRGQDLGGTLLTCYTERRPVPMNAKAPVHPDFDLFFSYDTIATDYHGHQISAGSLEGLSGQFGSMCRRRRAECGCRSSLCASLAFKPPSGKGNMREARTGSTSVR